MEECLFFSKVVVLYFTLTLLKISYLPKCLRFFKEGNGAICETHGFMNQIILL